MLSFIGSPGLVYFLGRGLNPFLLLLLLLVVVVLFVLIFCCCFAYESRMLLRVFDVGGGTSYILEWSDPWASTWDVRWVISVYSLDDRLCFAWSSLDNLIYFMLS